MPLPPLIEIVPLRQPVRSHLTIPGSKSITNRALVLAALATKPVRLEGALWSQDTQVMVDALRQLGFRVLCEPDPEDAGNRHLTVHGQAGRIPRAGSPSQPLELFVGNAGTAARFLAALVCLGQGTYRLDGVPRMRERPQADLFQALRSLGYSIETPTDRLPAILHGNGPRPGSCQVSLEQSSQFASALLLAANPGRWSVHVTGDNSEESPYVALTRKLVDAFPHTGGTFVVEPDASSASYFWAARHLLNHQFAEPSEISIARWPSSGWQIDDQFPRFLPLPDCLSRQSDLGDSIMTAIVLAPFASHPVSFTHLGRLRLQECERVTALRTELTRCGASVEESGDTLVIHPTPLHGAEIETYRDHRMAMCFATLGLRVPGLKIKNPACVSKTFPNFFGKIAAAPPSGLGATVRETATGQPLTGPTLLAVPST